MNEKNTPRRELRPDFVQNVLDDPEQQSAENGREIEDQHDFDLMKEQLKNPPLNLYVKKLGALERIDDLSNEEIASLFNYCGEKIQELIDQQKVSEDELDKALNGGSEDLNSLIEDSENENSGEDKESARKENIRILKSRAVADFLEKDNLSLDDIDALSYEATEHYIERYRNLLARELNGREYADKMNEAGLTPDDLNDKTIDELAKIKKDLENGVVPDAENEGEDNSAEDNEDGEKQRALNLRALGSRYMADALQEDGISFDDLKDKSNEELNELVEKYRKAAMRELAGRKMADKLKDAGVTIDELKDMSLGDLKKLQDDLEKEGSTEPEKDENKDTQKEPEEKTGEDEEEEKKDEQKGKMPEALVAVINNRERDAKIAARSLAEDMFKQRLEGNGKKFGKILRNIVFGQMLKESTMIKYERAALDAIKAGESEVKLNAGKKSEVGADISKVWSYDADGAGGKLVERLTLAYTKGIEDALVHGAAGNEMSTFGVEIDENGKKKVFKYSEGGNKKEEVDKDSAEAKSTIAVREAIEAFAQGKMNEDDFKEAIKREKANLAKEGVDDSLMTDTLFETALAAKQRFDHEESIENVMEGFRLINADYQAQVRTEAHRSKIDELTEKISGKLHIVQPEVIAAAAGVISFIGQKGASSALRAALPVVGGALAAGTFAGLKEHNRVAVDRAEQMRRLARGEEIGSSKYDKAMKETAYEMNSAADLASDLEKALAEGNVDEIINKLATAEQLTQFSDERGIDLISFSGGDNATIENERLALDIKIAEAKAKLKETGTDEDLKVYEEAVKNTTEQLETEINAKDEAFKKLRAKRVAIQAAKTAGIGIAAAGTVQEVGAAFNPNSYGIFDKINDSLGIQFKALNIGVNNADAHKTMLAGLLGISQEQAANTAAAATEVAIQKDASLTDEEVAKLRQEGYTVNGRQVTRFESRTHTETVSASEYARENGTLVSREFGGNGTSYSDGNELGLMRSGDGSLYAHMNGNSFSTESTINFEEAAQSGKLRMLVSLSKDAQSQPISVSGHIAANGDFIPDVKDSALADIIKEGKYAYAEIAYETGDVASNGAQEMFIFATHEGSNAVANLTQEVTESIPVTETLYDVIGFEDNAETILSGSLIDSGVVLPFVSRQNLTRAAEVAPEDGGEQEGGQEPAPEGEGEQQGGSEGSQEGNEEPGQGEGNTPGQEGGEPGQGEGNTPGQEGGEPGQGEQPDEQGEPAEPAAPDDTQENGGGTQQGATPENNGDNQSTTPEANETFVPISGVNDVRPFETRSFVPFLRQSPEFNSLSRDDVQTLSNTMRQWNSVNETTRQLMLQGDFSNNSDPEIMAKGMELLRRVGLIADGADSNQQANSPEQQAA